MSRHGGTALGGNTWRSSTTGVAATGLVSAPSCGLSVATTGAESAGSEATTEMFATELDSLELPEVDELEELLVDGSSTFKDYCDEEEAEEFDRQPQCRARVLDMQDRRIYICTVLGRFSVWLGLAGSF